MSMMDTIEEQLTPAEVAELREAVAVAHQRRRFKSPPTWITYSGGPLHGLRIPIENPGAYLHSWCIVTEHVGLVQAMYRAQEKGICQFAHYTFNKPFRMNEPVFRYP